MKKLLATIFLAVLAAGSIAGCAEREYRDDTARADRVGRVDDIERDRAERARRGDDIDRDRTERAERAARRGDDSERDRAERAQRANRGY